MGLLTFLHDRFQASCPAQVIGTDNTEYGTWLWGWELPALPAPPAVDADRVRDFVSRERLAAPLTRAHGHYRVSPGNALAPIASGTVTLEAP